jgi:hypothetical protein
MTTHRIWKVHPFTGKDRKKCWVLRNQLGQLEMTRGGKVITYKNKEFAESIAKSRTEQSRLGLIK